MRLVQLLLLNAITVLKCSQTPVISFSFVTILTLILNKLVICITNKHRFAIFELDKSFAEWFRVSNYY